MESSQTQDRTCVPYFGREVPILIIFINKKESSSFDANINLSGFLIIYLLMLMKVASAYLGLVG